MIDKSKCEEIRHDISEALLSLARDSSNPVIDRCVAYLPACLDALDEAERKIERLLGRIEKLRAPLISLIRDKASTYTVCREARVALTADDAAAKEDAT